MKNKTIVFYLVNFKKGGAEWVICNLANQMSEKGTKVHIISLKGGNMFQELSPQVRYHNPKGNILQKIIQSLTIIKAVRCDVLFTTQRGMSALSFILQKITRRKFRRVVREAASNFEVFFHKKSGLTSKIWRFLLMKAYSSADVVITNSEQTLKDLYKSNILKGSANNQYVIHNPVDIDKIKKKSKLPTDILVDNKFTNIITVSRLVTFKNVDVIIKAVDIAIKTIPNLRLYIVGDGPEESKLKQLSTQCGLENSIIFTGKVDNPYPILAQCELSILASSWEGFGMVVVESLIFGIPVIASDISGGPREILKNDELGIYFDLHSPQELADKIIRTLHTKTNSESLIARSLTFDMKHITELYNHAIQTK